MSYTVLETGLNVAPPASASLDPDYQVVIGDSASTHTWTDGDADFITLTSGLVSSVANQKTGGGAILTQAAAGSRPAMAASYLDGRDAFVFQRSPVAVPTRLLHTFPAGASLSWSKIMLVRDSEGATSAVQGALHGSAGNAAGAHRVNRNTTNIIHRVGGSTNEALVQVAIDWTVPHLIIASWDHATGTAGLSIDGQAFTTVTNAAAVCTATATSWGALPNDGSGAGWNGWMLTMNVDTLCLHLPANLEKLNWWKQLIRDDYPSIAASIA